MRKEFTTKKGNKVTVSVEKTTLKEKVTFIVGIVVIAGIVWWVIK